MGDIHWFIGLFYLDRINGILQDILLFIFITSLMKVMKNNPLRRKKATTLSAWGLTGRSQLLNLSFIGPQYHLPELRGRRGKQIDTDLEISHRLTRTHTDICPADIVGQK